MDFLKKNYEKILLGIVLLGLAAAVASLLFVIDNEKRRLTELKESVLFPKVTPLTNVNLTIAQESLKRVASPASIDFGPPNRLFNPMPWQKGEHLLPVSKVGPGALVVTNIQPLYLKLSLDSVNVSDSGPKYVIGIEKQAAPIPADRAKKQRYCTLLPTPTKNEVFTMLEVKGKPEDPAQIVVLLNDSGEKAVITKDQPFKRIDGYTADLRYDPEKKHWDNCRINSRPSPSFNGEEYNVVTINKDEVVLSAKSNQKKWTIKANSSPP